MHQCCLAHAHHPSNKTTISWPTTPSFFEQSLLLRQEVRVLRAFTDDGRQLYIRGSGSSLQVEARPRRCIRREVLTPLEPEEQDIYVPLYKVRVIETSAEHVERRDVEVGPEMPDKLAKLLADLAREEWLRLTEGKSPQLGIDAPLHYRRLLLLDAFALGLVQPPMGPLAFATLQQTVQ